MASEEKGEGVRKVISVKTPMYNEIQELMQAEGLESEKEAIRSVCQHIRCGSRCVCVCVFLCSVLTA